MSAADKAKLDGLSGGGGQGLRLHLANGNGLLPGSFFGIDGTANLDNRQVGYEVSCMKGTAVDWTLEARQAPLATVKITIHQATTGLPFPSPTPVVFTLPAGANTATSSDQLPSLRGDRFQASSDGLWFPGGLTVRARIRP